MPRKRPFLTPHNQTRPQRIAPHILPLLRITLRRSQNVVKKIRLPLKVHQPQASSKRLATPLLPTTHEFTQPRRIPVRRTEEMHVIRHDHITPHLPPVQSTASLPDLPQKAMHPLIRQHRAPPSHANRHKKHRLLHPHPRKTSQPLRRFLRSPIVHHHNPIKDQKTPPSNQKAPNL